MYYKKEFIYILFLNISIHLYAQSFAPQVGFEGNLAIHKDSIVFVDWAKEITIYRGYKNIENPNLGIVDYGEPENALNQADGNPNIISLGDSGIAILQFNYPVTNKNGPDFAVFENGFLKEPNSPLAFLELAFVEVSTDGIEYVRFPAISEIPTDNQVDSFGFIDARYIHNFAGKYINNYGTPFDLDAVSGLTENTTVDINNINYIKIIDATGTINPEYASYDAQNNIVNDPFPTAFSSGGFDLDAVGVIHNTQNTTETTFLQVYPNPFMNKIYIQTINLVVKKVQLFSIDGKFILEKNNPNYINTITLNSGIYILKVETNKTNSVFKLIKK